MVVMARSVCGSWERVVGFWAFNHSTPARVAAALDSSMEALATLGLRVKAALVDGAQENRSYQRSLVGFFQKRQQQMREQQAAGVPSGSSDMDINQQVAQAQEQLQVLQQQTERLQADAAQLQVQLAAAKRQRAAA